MNNQETPLFDPVTHDLLRAHTEAENAAADEKARLLKIMRDPGATELEVSAATEALKALWESSGGKPEVLKEILAGLPAKKEISVKDILVFDPLYPKDPPAGQVKAMLITSKGDRMFMLAVNLIEGYVGVPKYSGELYGEVLSGPVLLDDKEWR